MVKEVLVEPGDFDRGRDMGTAGSPADEYCSLVGYVSYNTTTWHLRLLRVGTTGDSYEIPLGDWQSYEANNNYQSVYVSNVSLITNADQGVLASYEVDTYPNTGSMTSAFYLATTSGPSIASNTQVAVVPQQATPVQPVLQRQDGNFVGVVSSSVGNFMVAFTPSGGTLFTVPNDTPQIATSDNGVIGASGTTYDQDGNVNGQVQNSAIVTSWSSQSYLASGGTSALALDLIDNADSASYWGFPGGNPSGNATAGLQCCFPSLAWVFGSTDTYADPPGVNKSYPLNNISCRKSPSQIISDMEANFGSFGNFNGTYSFHGIPWAVTGNVTFTGTVALNSTITINNLNVDTITGGHLKTMPFKVFVQVTQVSATSFTFTTLPGHVLYPATISFTASSSGAGTLSFTINVNGSFANKQAEEGFNAAGSALEDKIWNHVLTQVQADCSQ